MLIVCHWISSLIVEGTRLHHVLHYDLHHEERENQIYQMLLGPSDRMLPWSSTFALPRSSTWYATVKEILWPFSQD